MLKKGKIFENLGKNLQKLKIFWKGQVTACDYCMQQTASKGPDQYRHFQRVTFKYYYTKQNWHFQRVTAKYYILFPHKMYQTILLFLTVVNLFLIFIDRDKCKEYLQKSFCIEKVKNNIVYCWDIYYFLWLQASAFLK